MAMVSLFFAVLFFAVLMSNSGDEDSIEVDKEYTYNCGFGSPKKVTVDSVVNSRVYFSYQDTKKCDYASVYHFTNCTQ